MQPQKERKEEKAPKIRTESVGIFCQGHVNLEQHTKVMFRWHLLKQALEKQSLLDSSFAYALT